MGTIAKKYDAFRHGSISDLIGATITRNKVVLTRGVAARGAEFIARAMEDVRNFDAFTPDNDPYKEHDFGAFDLDGDKLFWKIDNYGGHEGIDLLLTVMFASEY